jgi:transposase InsO family protein
MLTPNQLTQYCRRLGLSEPARTVLHTIRTSPPVRRVRSSANNVAVRYPSRKMGVIIQAESHRNELAFVYEMEYDDEVLEFYDQPSTIKLEYQAKNRRNVGVLHTPDFFVLRTDAAGWEECKTEAELQKLADKMPRRYVGDEAGQWRCPPGERYAKQYGFYYRIRSSIEIDWIFQRNLVFLQDYLRPDCPEVDDVAAEEIYQLVADAPGLKLDQLLQDIHEATSDDIYRLIATGRVYTDLRAAPLAAPDQVRLFNDQWTARAFVIIPETFGQEVVGGFLNVKLEVNATIHWDGQPWTIINVGETDIWLRSGERKIIKLSPTEFNTLLETGAIVGSKEPIQAAISAEAQQLLAKASPEDLQVANARYQIIQPILVGGAPADGRRPQRTIYDWASKYRQAQRLHRCGFVGLLPHWHQCGNRTKKLPEATRVLLNEFIEDHYETLKQKFKYEVYGELLLACERQGIQVPSYKTFAEAINKRPGQQQTIKREGRRRAYAQEMFYWELELTTPRHGDRPFEIGHLDHTQLDIELIHSTTGRNLGRPWATFLMDAFSRRLLAVYLTFEAPSYRSCMMVLRECVRLHQRLPQCLVVDGGSEFKSVYFETLMACYECTKKTRPPGKGRFGSVCERLFGTTNTRFVYNLLGNTQIMRHARQVTKSVNPKHPAQWSLPRLYIRLRQWAYDVYETIEHPALGQTPREAFVNGLMRSGERPHRLIPYDEAFHIRTLPTTRKGTAKVDVNRGIKVHYIYYWTNDFRQSEVATTWVPVRYDPFDIGIAYAFVQGRWVRCISEYYARLQGRTEVELKLATTELRARHQRHTRQLMITAYRIADFIESLEEEEAMQTRLMSAAEGKHVLALINHNPSGWSHDPLNGRERAHAEEVDEAQEPIEADDEQLTPLDDYRL